MHLWETCTEWMEFLEIEINVLLKNLPGFSSLCIYWTFTVLHFFFQEYQPIIQMINTTDAIYLLVGNFPFLHMNVHMLHWMENKDLYPSKLRLKNNTIPSTIPLILCIHVYTLKIPNLCILIWNHFLKTQYGQALGNLMKIYTN